MTDHSATGTVSRHEFPFAQIPHAVIEDTGLSHTAVRVYAYLMRRADNETGNAFPGQRLIAKDINMSPSTVAKAITDLEERGWLEVTRRRTEKKEALPNHYVVRTTRGGVPNTGTRVPNNGTGGVPKSVTELDEDLTRTTELHLATRNVAWDFYTHPDGFNLPAKTKAQCDRVGRLARELNAKIEHEGGMTDTLFERAAAWPAHFPDATLTPEAFEKHFTQLGQPPLRRSKREVEQATERQKAIAMIAAGPRPVSDAQRKAQARR